MDAARNAYRQSRTFSMTRIDMLITLYQRLLQSIDEMQDALQASDDARVNSAQLNTSRYILALLDGIDPNQGEVAVNVQRLCHFAFTQISEQTVDGLNAARSVLQPLCDSFCAIRDEAAELELQGEIPPLDFESPTQQVEA